MSRWLAATAALVPSVAAQIKPILDASVSGALASCNGGSTADCGFKWTINAYDSTQGVGQQLSALELVHGQLASSNKLPGKAAAATKRYARPFVA